MSDVIVRQQEQEQEPFSSDGSPPPTAGKAFAKGGCGCLVAFLAVGILCVALGGSMRIDIGGVVLLFVIGGIIGLIVLYIYNRGRRDGGGSSDT